jgi:maleylacetate reductase
MQPGRMIFTKMDRVIFGHAAAPTIRNEAERLGAKRVFILAGGTLNRETDEVQKIRDALGERYAGTHDHMPAHSPRSSVVDCANAARDAGADLLVTVGGGSVTDGGKAVLICLEHGVSDLDGLEPFRTVVENGVRRFPDYRAPKIRQIAVPTTLSAGEFNARAGITDTRQRLKQSYIHPGLIPETVILDPAITIHTPEWLWLSSGVRAIDHAVETLCSIDANEYTDGTSMQALRALSDGLTRVKADPDDLEGRLRCLMGAWLSMVGVVTGTRLGASHAIGHILGGTANVPHGHTSCVMLPYVMAYNVSVNAGRQQEVSAALGQPDRPASVLLDELISGLGMPRTLRDVGVKEELLPQLAQNCMLDDWTFSNPRKISTPEEVMEILRMAW